MKFVINVTPGDWSQLPYGIRCEIEQKLPQKIQREAEKIEYERQQLEYRSEDLRLWQDIARNS